MSNPSDEKKEVSALQIELEITIKASRERVWKALVEESTMWWRKDFYATANPKAFIIEPKIGGRVYEDAGDGAGLIWYNVIGIETGRSINCVGHISPPYGGPATSLLRLSLEEKGKNETVLRLTDALFGHLPSCSAKEGWLMLFDESFKAYVEGRNE
ncbi:MAG: hypothetical protein SGI97_07485 [candidate division Zixibacteria bacterium]|nr:hypothetical protein [candidate division Zixibacteria bacterium]